MIVASPLTNICSHTAGVWRAYHIDVDPTSHDNIHSAPLHIVDAHGDERPGYVTPFLPQLVTADMRAVERAGG
ncbi:MAG TPA: hypothetical protein VE777_15480 [Gaiellales bacterium]|jgi:hypothetical protein|nr:hypothetical protein [Gaiellales bacterium]